VNVIALQPDIEWENKPANFHRVRRLLAQAAPEKDSLVILPEMFATGFSMNMEKIAEFYGGETEQFLAGIAREYGIGIIAGVATRGRSGQVRNKALVFSTTGELVAFYSKRRPFTPGGENEHCVPGERPVVFEFAGWGISPLICYDLRFPELFREAAAVSQPALFVVIANWPAKRSLHWLRLLPARAIENQAYVVGVNRVGTDPFYHYKGRSMVLDPQGEVLADAGENEGWVRAHLDSDNLKRYREGLPFLRDLKMR
jgi:omega-amidase